MEITLKNNIGGNKGKQCQYFISVLKKLKLLITKDRRLNFYVEKGKFVITTFAARSLQDPPAGSPTYFIDYQFGDDMYILSQFAGQSPYMFCFDIQDCVRMITHYYQTKMSILKLSVNDQIDFGCISFQVPQQAQGQAGFYVQKLNRFPLMKDLNKNYIQTFTLFQLQQKEFEQIKQIQDMKFSCFYQIHEQGIYMKNYDKIMQKNNFLLKKQNLKSYEPVFIKQRLKGNRYIEQPNNYLIEEVKIASKKNYRYLKADFIIIHNPQNYQDIRKTYIKIECQISGFQKTIKRLIANCSISNQINLQGYFVFQSNAEINQTNLLKSEEPVIEGLRRIILNRWVQPRAVELIEEREQNERERLGARFLRDEMLQETNTRKIMYKLEDIN